MFFFFQLFVSKTSRYRVRWGSKNTQKDPNMFHISMSARARLPLINILDSVKPKYLCLSINGDTPIHHPSILMGFSLISHTFGDTPWLWKPRFLWR